MTVDLLAGMALAFPLASFVLPFSDLHFPGTFFIARRPSLHFPFISCMKYRRLAVLVFAAAAPFVRAQQADDEHHAPPTEIPDFSNLDEFIYEPRSTLILSVRQMSGVKAKFFGGGSLTTTEDPGVAGVANQLHIYHDGSVSPDARTAPRTDGNGNPITDPGSSGQLIDVIAPDGKTNTWSYTDQSQLRSDGFMAFHSYSANVTDQNQYSKDGASNMGMELAMTRDMGALFHSKITWGLTFGVALNDIQVKRVATVQANLNTITDLYSLYGQTPPDAPYTAPSSNSSNIVDANGNQVLNADGSAATVATDTTVLLQNQPADRQTTNTTDTTSVTDQWHVHGAYFTFRGGPTFDVPITSHFHAQFSAGAALVYSGSTYTVIQTYQPATGDQITNTSTSDANHLLPGYFADASIQYNLTDRAGFFAGAVMQSAGSYTQVVNTDTAHYSTRLDFSNQNGLRAGMTVRF